MAVAVVVLVADAVARPEVVVVDSEAAEVHLAAAVVLAEAAAEAALAEDVAVAALAEEDDDKPDLASNHILLQTTWFTRYGKWRSGIGLSLALL